MDTELVKLKRQIRDWYNKHTNDLATLIKVAEVINFPNNKKENDHEQKNM